MIFSHFSQYFTVFIIIIIDHCYGQGKATLKHNLKTQCALNKCSNVSEHYKTINDKIMNTVHKDKRKFD